MLNSLTTILLDQIVQEEVTIFALVKLDATVFLDVDCCSHKKQDSYDPRINLSDKTVVGAINQLVGITNLLDQTITNLSAELKAEINKKLDKRTTDGKTAAYIVEGDNQALIMVEIPEVPLSLVRRNGAGQIFTINPTEYRHAANKGYVDNVAIQTLEDAKNYTDNVIIEHTGIQYEILEEQKKADVVTKSVRLIDKEVRLYPRVKLEDIVKSVAADGTETVAKLVEQSNNENIVYGTKVTGGLLQQATITYSESLKGSTIPVRTAGGMLLVENPSSDTPQAAVNLLYANTTYGRLGAGNDWTGLNKFGAEKISVHATDNSIYMKLAEQGFFIKTGPSSEEYFVKLPDLAGTLTTEAALNSSAASTLSSAKSYTDTQINAKLSSKVVYGETETDSTTWGTASMVLASRLKDGHMLAKEAYRVQTTMTTTETHDTLPTSKAVLDFVMTRFTELNQSVSLKVDKKTTAGTFAYAHVGGAQTEFPVTPETAVSSIVYRDSAGRTKAIGPTATLSTATATNIGVVISDAERDYVTTGSILQTLVTRINSSLGLISNSLINKSLITYEEVSA